MRDTMSAPARSGAVACREPLRGGARRVGRGIAEMRREPHGLLPPSGNSGLEGKAISQQRPVAEERNLPYLGVW